MHLSCPAYAGKGKQASLGVTSGKGSCRPRTSAAACTHNLAFLSEGLGGFSEDLSVLQTGERLAATLLDGGAADQAASSTHQACGFGVLDLYRVPGALTHTGAVE